MAGYLAMRIMANKLGYKEIIEKFPQFKGDIDEILILEGKQNLIVA